MAFPNRKTIKTSTEQQAQATHIAAVAYLKPLKNTPTRPKTTATYSGDLSRCSDVIQWPTEVIT
ncbi:hypothetical protein [Xylella fastidiosa]|uniref:hypothetical protein n=1 Tax=Xylella fastidiosa TaxID=2371 RepID=UPI00031D79E0|nr:hypothetical protein [Xylella fastidiosa]UIX81707.1 hypothetical protein LZ756_02180 [Xylella fastidiosa subsp. sandyi]